MVKKNCRLADKEGTKCIECIECLYKIDKKNRPWIYEKSLNSGFFKIDVEETVEQEKEVTLDNYF